MKYLLNMDNEGKTTKIGNDDSPKFGKFVLTSEIYTLSSQKSTFTLPIIIDNKSYNLLLAPCDLTYPFPTKAYYGTDSSPFLEKFDGTSWSNVTNSGPLLFGVDTAYVACGYSKAVYTSDDHNYIYNFSTDVSESKTASAWNLYSAPGPAMMINGDMYASRMNKYYTMLTDSWSSFSCCTYGYQGDMSHTSKRDGVRYATTHNKTMWLINGQDNWNYTNGYVLAMTPKLSTTNASVDSPGPDRYFTPGISVDLTRIYYCGGRDYLTSTDEYNDTYEFISTTTVYTHKTDMVAARVESGSFSLSHKFYICGGWTYDSADHSNPVIDHNNTYSFNPTTNSWTTEPNMTGDDSGMETFNPVFV